MRKWILIDVFAEAKKKMLSPGSNTGELSSSQGLDIDELRRSRALSDGLADELLRLFGEYYERRAFHISTGILKADKFHVIG